MDVPPDDPACRRPRLLMAPPPDGPAPDGPAWGTRQGDETRVSPHWRARLFRPGAKAIPRAEPQV